MSLLDLSQYILDCIVTLQVATSEIFLALGSVSFFSQIKVVEYLRDGFSKVNVGPAGMELGCLGKEPMDRYLRLTFSCYSNRSRLMTPTLVQLAESWVPEPSESKL